MNNVRWSINRVPMDLSLLICHSLYWKNIFSETISSILRRRSVSLCWQILLLSFYQWGKLSITESQNFCGLCLLHIFVQYLPVTLFTFTLWSTLLLQCNFQEFMRNVNNLWGLLITTAIQRCTWKNNCSNTIRVFKKFY